MSQNISVLKVDNVQFQDGDVLGHLGAEARLGAQQPCDFAGERDRTGSDEGLPCRRQGIERLRNLPPAS